MYEGGWKNDLTDGLGKMVFKCGDVYEGDYNNNNKNVKGTYSY